MGTKSVARIGEPAHSDIGGDPSARESRVFWCWTALGLGVLSIGKTLREPASWAYTQAQLDYSAGFMRRGLFGEMFGRSLRLYHYENFAIFSTALLFLLLAAFVLLAWKAKVAQKIYPGELLAVFSSSFSVSYLVHLNGYLDIPMALLCIAPLVIRRVGLRLWVATICTVAGVLIHEQFFFAFLPLVSLSFVLNAVQSESPSAKRLAWACAIAVALVGTGLTGYLGSCGEIPTAKAELVKHEIESRADRPLNPAVIEVISRTASENAKIMESVWRRPTFIPGQIESLLMFGPTTAALSYATLLLLRRRFPGSSRWLYSAVVVATLAPLSLNLFGWDKNRWNQFTCVNAYLLLLIVTQMIEEPLRLPLWFRRACLVIMLVNMATGAGLMGNLQIRLFPFLRNPNAGAAW